ncbi:hypothetical protein MAR_031997, partial [Mya arenaria]
FSELIEVEGRSNDVFKQALEDIVQKINNYITPNQTIIECTSDDKELLDECRIPPTFGTDKYMQWSSEFEHKIAQISSDDIRRVLQPCWEFLQEYNKALLVYNDARLKEALKILSEFILNVKKVQTYHSTDNFLLELYTDLEHKTSALEDINPKLIKLQEILKTFCRSKSLGELYL